MKNIIKTIAILAITVLTLAGCNTNNKTEFDINEIISEVLENTSTTTVEEPTTSTTSTVESKPEESSTTSTIASEPTEKPVETTSTPEVKEETSKPTASTTTSTITSKPTEKPVEKPATKPATSSTTSTTITSKPTEKPVEKPKPTSSTTTTKPVETKPIEKPTTPSKPVHTHNFIEGKCNCGKVDPNYVAPHNCKTDGHIWENYTETSTEEVEIKETHTVVANGYDITLARRYFGESCKNFTPYLGTNAFGAGSEPVKTTDTKTITTYYHKCTECGFNEAYNTEKTVTPGDTWTFVYGPRSKFYPVVWYDINNIPAEILEGREKEKAFEEDVWASL